MRSGMYVRNENNLIYAVVPKKMHVNYIELSLELVCGVDYINPDESNTQGYVDKSRFIDDVQYETEVCYFCREGVIQSLEENGYTEVKELPFIHGLNKED